MDLIPALLILLALLDGTLAGFRDAAGRNPHIHKGDYYRRALVRGAVHGVVAMGIGAAGVAALLGTSSTAGALYRDLLTAGAVMLKVYLPYTLIVLSALSLHLMPSFEARTLSSVIILGPGTFLRPWFIGSGAVAAALVVPQPRVMLAATVASVAVALVPKVLARRWREVSRPRGDFRW